MTSPDGRPAGAPGAVGGAPPLPVADLMTQLGQRADDIVSAQRRLRGLLAANRSIVGELSLPRVLQKIVEAAREIAGARYAALGVLAPDGGFEQLVHSGMDEQTVAGIQDFPSGQGVLGVLVGHAEPIRVGRIADHPRSFGFPAGHPPMQSFLGVPITAHGSVFGNLYITEPVAGGEFSAEDEDLVAALAATAGIAVENARLYEESRRRQEWLLASSEISQQLLAAGDDERAVLSLIAVNVHHLARAALVCIVVPDEDDPALLRIAAAAGRDEHALLGLTYPVEGSLAGLAMREGRGRVVDSGAQHNLRWLLRPDTFAGPVMALPLTGEWGARGAVVVGRLEHQPIFSMADVAMAEDFAGQAAIALELAGARSAQLRLGALEDRERIARDLHDHVIQRLFATGLTLQSTAGSAHDPAVRDRLGRTVADLDETIRQIRTSIFALQYARPAAASVRATVAAVVDDLSAALGFRPSTHLAGPLDTLVEEDLVVDVAAVVREALADVARHGRARRCSVVVEADAGELRVVVADDGAGLVQDGRRSGLADLRERALRRGGGMTTERADEGGLRVRWSVPLT
ncbi:GAF domain-containing protein [Microlunatus capsulatus]|uniref:Signal transduction histidine kinase n=1 Tax=Microlunatus capsulatus TaxID=99117 RepID=A0ABS4Z7Y1_9ACTN|nr:GAF domain-containing protein [Microlunatus capsulatus]MBP2417143.1 signal transduction histidine kinase [Microlunatus capsulatus]